MGDAEKARGGFAVDDGLDVGAARLIVVLLLVALREHVRGAHLLEHPLVLGVKDGVQASAQHKHREIDDDDGLGFVVPAGTTYIYA